VCPSQVEPQSDPGRNKSLLPVSKSTECYSVNFGHDNLLVSKRGLTSKGHWRGTDGDGAIPELGIVIGEGVAVSSLG
jgi:hypothetical protein